MLHVQIQIVFLYYNLYLNTIIHSVRTPLSTTSLPGNYIRQINKLRTLYQIDKNEPDNLNRQKTILFWSWFAILFIVILIVCFIFLVKRGNKKLHQSQ